MTLTEKETRLVQLKFDLADAQWDRFIIHAVFTFAAIVAWLLSTSFLVTFFVGGTLDFSEWDKTKWMYATLALFLTASITAFQYFLYQSGRAGAGFWVAVAVVVIFSSFTELANVLQREGETVRSRSEQSQTYQQAVGSIGAAVKSGINQGVSPTLLKAMGKKANAEAELLRCKRHTPLGQVRVNRCIDIETRNFNKADRLIKSIEKAEADAATSNTSLIKATVEIAKDLEHNKDYHFEAVKLLMTLGLSALVASLLISVLIVGSFEFAFHGIGSFYSESKQRVAQIIKRIADLELVVPTS